MPRPAASSSVPAATEIPAAGLPCAPTQTAARPGDHVRPAFRAGRTCRDAARRAVRAGPDERAQRRLESRAAGIKAVATWHATATIQTAREACGGAGYLAENLLPDLKADTDVFTTFEGDNTVLLQLVAKGLLTDYRDNFADLSPLATARLVAEQLMGAVLERLPARKLVSPATARPRLAPEAVRRPGTTRPRRPRPPAAGRRVVGRRPVRRVQRRPGPRAAGRPCAHRPARPGRVRRRHRRVRRRGHRAARPVCDLYVAVHMEADRAWFLEHGRLSPPLAPRRWSPRSTRCAGSCGRTHDPGRRVRHPGAVRGEQLG